LPQVIAPPNGPVVPGAWKPRGSSVPFGRAPDADHHFRARRHAGDEIAPA
jgi:hypothetical protein